MCVYVSRMKLHSFGFRVDTEALFSRIVYYTFLTVYSKAEHDVHHLSYVSVSPEVDSLTSGYRVNGVDKSKSPKRPSMNI